MPNSLDATNPVAVDAIQTKSIGQGTAGPVSSPDAGRGTDPLERAPGSSGATHSERWYAVHHKAHEAPTARLKIRRLGFQTHWPRYILRRPRRDDVITPLFPGYLFVKLDIRRRSWGPIQAIDEVVGMLGAYDGRPPAAAPIGEVERLIQRAGGCDKVIDETPDSLLEMQPGDSVLIVDGLFNGFGGLLRGDHGPERVAVLMTMLGIQREVIVPRRNIRRAEV
ncbi:transcription termination/antitermination protein NusG [Rhodovarius lipocyclicus]|uniref:transcription termination/antitermination protein NusG n=1 Tax=Rhodovarius lipocyclicus TaxID=268410 RepID=UPI00135B2AB0|nr:transcription termination/antitermination NusG family protein [Rhodovarius lipocyclicus]